MKNLIALASVLALSVVPAFAAEGHVSDQSLAKMGLTGMKTMTDTQGLQIRGMSATAGGYSIASVPGAGAASTTYASGSHSAEAAGVSIAALSISGQYVTVAIGGGFAAAHR